MKLTKRERKTLRRMKRQRLKEARAKGIVRGIHPNSDAFLASYEWRRVRMQALKIHGSRCQCCGATPADGLKMHVDHIKPRRQFPALALDVNNLQVLCEVCNHGKGNWDQTDWRPQHEPELTPEQISHLRDMKH
jgi:5-methylcytosine-specific restriction endonuclease McrA